MQRIFIPKRGKVSPPPLYTTPLFAPSKRAARELVWRRVMPASLAGLGRRDLKEDSWFEFEEGVREIKEKAA